MVKPVTRVEVISHSHALPSLPRVVQQILETLEDPDANLNLLVSHIEHDPALTGQILAMANKAGVSRYGNSNINDVFTAISLVGLSRVREVALLNSVLQVFAVATSRPVFWLHSVAVGVSCVELAHFSRAQVNVDTALIAGLLHDIGQLWLHGYEPSLFAQVRDKARTQGQEITLVEREQFGVDHGEIGVWLAEHWGLSSDIGTAIGHHHTPGSAASKPLTAVVHVAEVLSNALDLTKNLHGSVTTVSAACCATLGLDWGEGSHHLFGRIEARNRQAASMFER